MTAFQMTGVEPQRGEYHWVVKQNTDGTPFLVGEPTGVSLKLIGTKGEELQVGFELSPRTKLNDAKAIARVMNHRITHIVLF